MQGHKKHVSHIMENRLLFSLLSKGKTPCDTQELDVIIFNTCIYPLRSKGKDGHSAAAQIVSG